MNARAALVALALCTTAGAGHAFDRVAAAALGSCHTHVWNEVPEFRGLPNAAISV